MDSAAIAELLSGIFVAFITVVGASIAAYYGAKFSTRNSNAG